MQIELRELADRYAKMSDEELRETASSYDGLTDAAQDALRSEMASRKLGRPEDAQDDGGEAEVRGAEIPANLLRDSAEVITIDSFLDIADVQRAQQALLAAGIPVYFGIQVDAVNRSKAIELIDKLMPYPEMSDGVTEYRQPLCPDCKSENVKLLRLEDEAESWRCKDCGHRWEISK